MIKLVGVPTMTLGELRQVIHELMADSEEHGVPLDDCDVRIQSSDSGLNNLRTVEVKREHSDFTDGRDPHTIVIFNTAFYD